MPTSTSPPLDASNPRSGAVLTPAGDRRIPSSTRADGSLRKEIKIRPGYRPPEDVEVYKNRTAESWKTRGTGGIPGAESLQSNEGPNAGGTAAGKNAKRREARKRAKAAGGESVDGDEDSGTVDAEAKLVNQSASKSKTQSKDPQTPDLPAAMCAAAPAPELDPEAEKEKQARNLKKKLRQARELREKKNKGENLLPEQFEKVIKINELIRQLDSLGFDSEGTRKA